MPLSYSEISAANIARWTSHVVGTDIYCPQNGGTGCTIIDTTTDTASSITLSASRSRQTSQLVGSTIYMPNVSSASCGKLNTATNTSSEIALARSTNRRCSALDGTRIYCPVQFGSTQILWSVLNTATDTETEVFSTPGATRTPGAATSTPGFVFVAGARTGGGFVGRLNTSTLAYTETLISHAANWGLRVGNLWFVWNATTGAGSIIDLATLGATSFTLPAQARNGAGFPVVNDAWILTASATAGVDAVTPAGVVTRPLVFTNRDRVTAQLVGTKAYLPSNGHGSVGILLDIPFPRPRGYRGIGLVRGSRG